jgi:hypothetical protein
MTGALVLSCMSSAVSAAPPGAPRIASMLAASAGVFVRAPQKTPTMESPSSPKSLATEYAITAARSIAPNAKIFARSALFPNEEKKEGPD